MANFINKIKIGAVEYNIGMENALHFDGLALIGTWFVDEACKTAATAANLTETQSFLYYNAASIGENQVKVGCVYIPATGSAAAMAATGYELVCIEKAEVVSKWAILGEVKKETATGVRAVTTAAKAVVTGATPMTANFLASITPSTASIAAGVATASVNVITATPGAAAITAQDVISGVSAPTTTINYGTKISAGSVTANHVTTAAPVTVAGSVSGGSASGNTGSKSIECTEASGVAGKVGITLTTASKTVATGVSTTSVKQPEDPTAITVVDGVLNLPTAVIAALAAAKTVATGVATASIAVPTAAAMAADVITAVNTSVVSHTISGVVTSVSYTNPSVSVSLPTSVVTGVSYTAPTLTTAAQALVSSVSATGAATIGAVATDAKLISSVPYAAKTVATAAGAAKTVVTSVTAGSAAAVTGVTISTANVNQVTSVTTGTVVTAVL